MRRITMAILNHDLPAPDELDPQPDQFITQTLVTVVSGDVTGELDRVVSLDEDGGDPIVLFETRIDCPSDGAGMARIEVDSARTLADLAAVAGYLSRELARVTGRAPSSALGRVYTVEPLEGGHLYVDLTSDGVAFTVARGGGDQLTATVREPMMPHLLEAIRDELSD